MCAPKIRAGRMADVLEAFDRHAARGGGFAFLTLTVQHSHGEKLAELLALLGGAWAFVARSREYRQWRERLGLLGNITALEVTDGRNSWHPHRHVMLFFERPPSRDEVEALEAVLDELYGRWLAKQGRKRGGVDQHTGRRVGVRLDYVPPDSAGRREQLGCYLTKLQAGFELARGDLKQSRQAAGAGGRLPMDLLDVIEAGGDDQAAAVARWREYEQAMTGKSAVRFSKGLRGELGMETAKTDQELAEEEVGGESGIFVTARLYRRSFKDGHAPALLAAYGVGGDVQVLRLLNLMYPGKIVAEDGHLVEPGTLLVDLRR
ncbi:protein rep [Pseudonocardia sp. RS010]|uniref:protein rep n=1 Tax=Pseudonocardia sp. RS010 TaxID=3385979 RepID=UPI0039A1AF99